MGCRYEDVRHPLTASMAAAAFVVLRYTLVFIGIGILDDDVPGVDKPGDLGGGVFVSFAHAYMLGRCCEDNGGIKRKEEKGECSRSLGR